MIIYLDFFVKVVDTIFFSFRSHG